MELAYASGRRLSHATRGQRRYLQSPPGSRRGLYAFARYASLHLENLTWPKWGRALEAMTDNTTRGILQRRRGNGRSSGIRLTRREFVLDRAVAKYRDDPALPVTHRQKCVRNYPAVHHDRLALFEPNFYRTVVRCRAYRRDRLIETTG